MRKYGILPWMAVALIAVWGCDASEPVSPTSQPSFHDYDNDNHNDKPPPPVGDEGCTPGFWKNNTGAWGATGYAPDDAFHDIFSGDRFENMTLHDVISQGGGHWNALGRQAVAALLNAAHPDVAFGLTVVEVLDAWEEAKATGDWETTKDMFEEYNEEGCPLPADPGGRGGGPPADRGGGQGR